MNNPNRTEQSRTAMANIEEFGRERFLSLVYLGFLFIPLAMKHNDLQWLWWTLLSIAVFLLWFYFRQYRQRNRMRLGDMLVAAALGYALVPVNFQAITYLIYAAAFAAWIFNGILRPLLLTAVLLSLLALEILWLGIPWLLLWIAACVSTITCLGNCFIVERFHKNAALRISQEEVRRLAALAERERIGRDLHDLLGHTLSLVAIKSELAGKLLARDTQAAAREIADVTDVARQALKQVRTAVSGIRAAALEVELLSARVLLESSGVALICQRDTPVLPVDIETSLAMMVRECATNIHRHAEARNAKIELRTDARMVTLIISDDGRGGVSTYGNGLSGLTERIRNLGGTLQIESLPGKGTTLNVVLPLKTIANSFEDGVAPTRSLITACETQP